MRDPLGEAIEYPSSLVVKLGGNCKGPSEPTIITGHSHFTNQFGEVDNLDESMQLKVAEIHLKVAEIHYDNMRSDYFDHINNIKRRYCI